MINSTLFQSLFSLFILHSSYGESMHIDCTGTHNCYNQTLTCSSTNDCIINCDGNSSCTFSTIICPQSQSTFGCTLLCNDNLSCNNINIYTINNYDTINIECKSINCWSNQHNPVIHYGDATYSKMCTVYDTNIICEPNTVLIAHNNNNNAISTTIATRTISDNDDTVNVYENNSNNHSKYKLNDPLILISIGIFSGLLISLCGFAFIFCFRSHDKSSKLRIIKATQISPSLKRLSPALRPMVELSNIDFYLTKSELNMETYTDKTTTSDGIVVTVERYSNDQNECDEEELNINSNGSPIQSVNLQHLGLVSVKSLSETETINDEFVVLGDDDVSHVTTPC